MTKQTPAAMWLGLALLAVAGALALRLHGLDLRSISHPEVYVPGIPLPQAHTVPPPRLTWADTLWMHYHDEPHPMGWYLAMFLWTGIAGVSEWALRLPSAILGAATVWVAFVVGRRAYGAQAGALAAALLALHGFHLYLSQIARMYAAGTFFGLLSTALLLAFVYDPKRPRWAGLGYVLSIVATAGSVEFVWPLLGIQILWATLALPPRRRFRWGDLVRARFDGVHPAVQLQAIAVMLSAPELLHSVYRARHDAVEQRVAEFLREFLSFGFLFSTDRNALPVMSVAWPIAIGLLALGLLSVGRGAFAPACRPRAARREIDVPRWLPLAAAVGASGFMAWLAIIAQYRNAALLVVSLGPLLALFLPAFVHAASHGLSAAAGVGRWREGVAGPRLLVLLLGLGAPLVLIVMSFKVSILADRAFLIFVPCLVIAVAGGVATIGQPVLRGAATVAVLAIFAASVPYSYTRPGAANDYKGLAARMAPDLRADDLIFVLDRSWTDTPLFYYLPDARYVFADYAAALQENPGARVWLVTWPWEGLPVVTDARREALANYRRQGQVEARRASAELFVPPGSP